MIPKGQTQNELQKGRRNFQQKIKKKRIIGDTNERKILESFDMNQGGMVSTQ